MYARIRSPLDSAVSTHELRPLAATSVRPDRLKSRPACSEKPAPFVHLLEPQPGPLSTPRAGARQLCI